MPAVINSSCPSPDPTEDSANRVHYRDLIVSYRRLERQREAEPFLTAIPFSERTESVPKGKCLICGVPAFHGAVYFKFRYFCAGHFFRRFPHWMLPPHLDQQAVYDCWRTDRAYCAEWGIFSPTLQLLDTSEEAQFDYLTQAIREYRDYERIFAARALYWPPSDNA